MPPVATDKSSKNTHFSETREKILCAAIFQHLTHLSFRKMFVQVHFIKSPVCSVYKYHANMYFVKKGTNIIFSRKLEIVVLVNLIKVQAPWWPSHKYFSFDVVFSQSDLFLPSKLVTYVAMLFWASLRTSKEIQLHSNCLTTAASITLYSFCSKIFYWRSISIR